MLFFELLQVAIGNRKELTHAPTAEEWSELYTLAQRQTLVGIAFRAVEQLPEAQRPPKALLMQWMMATERIKALNTDLDRKALAVANKFLEEGFPGMVLKGQGIAQLYRVKQIESSRLKIENYHPDGVTERTVPLRQGDEQNGATCNGAEGVCLSLGVYRTPGDIDIWLHRSRGEVLKYVRHHVPDCKPVYHHVDFPVIKGLDIEVHFTPSWMNSPVTNRRLQRWFRDGLEVKKGVKNAVTSDLQSEVEGKQGFVNPQLNGIGLQIRHDKTVPLFIEGRAERSGVEGVSNIVRRDNYSELPTPSLAFNRVYILVHIYRHLFGEGIGLRQLLDYYFVLHQGFTEEERAETMRTLRSLRMQRFTAAVMWVLHEVFGMEECYMLTAPNEREGRFLLSEIMLAGNFGHYDERIKRVSNESSIHIFIRRVARNFRFVRSYPSEVLWSPLWKIWHWGWRRRMAKG